MEFDEGPCLVAEIFVFFSLLFGFFVCGIYFLFFIFIFFEKNITHKKFLKRIIHKNPLLHVSQEDNMLIPHHWSGQCELSFKNSTVFRKVVVKQGLLVPSHVRHKVVAVDMSGDRLHPHQRPIDGNNVTQGYGSLSYFDIVI